MVRLKEAIGVVDNLVFISDRHASIANALAVVFPEAHHGACIYHVSMNMTAKFKTDNCHEEYFMAAKAYRVVIFRCYFDQIREKNPQIAEYLQNSVGLEKWARASFPSHRYNLMTTGIAESWNNVTLEAQNFPITPMLEFIRFTLQKWFFEWRTEAEQCKGPLSKAKEKYLCNLSDKAQGLLMYPVSQYEMTVIDADLDGEVNL